MMKLKTGFKNYMNSEKRLAMKCFLLVKKQTNPTHPHQLLNHTNANHLQKWSFNGYAWSFSLRENGAISEIIFGLSHSLKFGLCSWFSDYILPVCRSCLVVSWEWRLLIGLAGVTWPNGGLWLVDVRQTTVSWESRFKQASQTGTLNSLIVTSPTNKGKNKRHRQ